MTAAWRSESEDQSPFSQWIREHPDLDARRESLSVTDNDYWVHKFVRRQERHNVTKGIGFEAIMLVEVKAFSANTSYAQRDTLSVVDGLMRAASIRNGRRYTVKVKDADNPGCKRVIRPLGAHVLRMSSDRPDTSDRLFWDQRQITLCELLELLRFQRDPDCPSKEFGTRRHHLPTARDFQPLFDWQGE